MEDKKPVIIGIGGLLERGERGKVTDMLDTFSSEYGCRTYEVGFNDIRRDGDTIICTIAPKDREAVSEVVDLALSDTQNDINRIGVIVSSMGAVPFMEYLATSNKLTSGLKAYAANVPFTKINPNIRTFVETFRDSGKALEIGSAFDKGRGISRVIPASCLQYILDMDVNELIKTSPNKYNLNLLSIIAKRDERVDTTNSLECHTSLGGNTSGILIVDSGHAVPYEISRKPIMEFMIHTLNLNSNTPNQPDTDTS